LAISGGAGAASAGGGGASTANVGGPTNRGAAGGGSTVGGYQPPTGGNSMSDSDLLIVQDYESNLKIVDQIVQRIDKRPLQVLIEAVIISVDLEHSVELGVNFAVVDSLGTVLGTTGSGAAINSSAGFNPSQLLTTAGKLAGSATDPTGFSSATNGAKFGFVNSGVTGFIQALETIGSTKILASPRILVLNKQRAEIQLGQRLGFQTFSQNFTSTIQQVQFLNTGTLLRIRPFISEDGMIRMELHPERSSGSVTNNIPNQNTAELTTNIMVPDGATLVIGGLMEDEDDYSIQGLPGLSKMPVLGHVFGFRQKNEGRRELVVLLTPHIWSADQVMAHGPVPINCVQPNQVANAEDLASAPNPAAERPAGDSARIDPAVSERSNSPAPPQAAATAASPKLAEPVAAASTEAPRAAPTSAGTDKNHEVQDSQAQRRPFFRALLDRIAHRGDSPNREQPKPGARNADPGSPCEPVSTTCDPLDPIGDEPDSSSRAPQGRPVTAPAAAAAPARRSASVASVTADQPVRDDMVGRAGWVSSSPGHTETREAAPGRADSEPRARPSGQPRAQARGRGMIAGPRRHTVESGETLASIARLYYGSERYAASLWWVNRGHIERPDDLKPGDLVVVPAVNELETPRRAEGSTASRAPSRNTATELALIRASRALPDSAELPPGSAVRGNGDSRRRNPPIHVVLPNETLRSIARDRLGDSHRANEIAELNRDRLLDAGALEPGQTLVLPADARPAGQER
jgi:nucleoid-associated protein YgaU